MDIEKLWGLVDAWGLWAVGGVPFGLGALGGVIRALTADPPPDPPPQKIDARMAAARPFFVGRVAAVAETPEAALKMIRPALAGAWRNMRIGGSHVV